MSSVVYTVGHSNHDSEQFLALLKMHEITAIADVRSRPYSRYHPQFDRETLRAALQAEGIQYVFLGEELGARSSNLTCYVKGVVQYDRLARTEEFQKGRRRVLEGAETYRIALMCAEKEPLECHRTILVARRLAELGAQVVHIHADGHRETHEEALSRLARMLRVREDEMHLFRSAQDLVDDLYTMQEARIAYEAESGSEDGLGVSAA